MTKKRGWVNYSADFRPKEMSTVANWIRSSASGSVVGLAGSGKTNFLEFISHRPDILQSYLGLDEFRVMPIPVDLNNLPNSQLATLYRLILRSFYEVRAHFEHTLQEAIGSAFQENLRERDAFVVQTALRRLFFLFEERNIRIVLVIDRFDHFSRKATPQMADTLRGLRDSFKNNVCFIVGMETEIRYVAQSAELGSLYDLLDSNVCWISHMTDVEARDILHRETVYALNRPKPHEIAQLINISGAFPSLIKAAAAWWRNSNSKPPIENWGESLINQSDVQHRLRRIWGGLTQEERLALCDLENLAENKQAQFEEKYLALLSTLLNKGVVKRAKQKIRWQISGELLARYVSQQRHTVRGKVWHNQDEDTFYQGGSVLSDLSPRAQSALSFFIQNPRKKCDKDQLINIIWGSPDVTDDSLYQVISELRKALEPSTDEYSYIVNHRGIRRSSYQFFPEGRPM